MPCRSACPCWLSPCAPWLSASRHARPFTQEPPACASTSKAAQLPCPSCCSSMDASATRYAARVSMQAGRQEIIVDLKNMVGAGWGGGGGGGHVW